MINKTKHKGLLILALFFTVFLLTATLLGCSSSCGGDDGENGYTPTHPRLETPTLSLDIKEDTLSWNGVNSAVGYRLEFGDAFYEELEANILYVNMGNLLTMRDIVHGFHAIRVIALGDNVSFSDSLPASVDYMVATQGLEFTPSVTRDGVASFSVSRGEVSPTYTNIYVPHYYNDGQNTRPITSITMYGFAGTADAPSALEEIFLPDSIEHIAHRAFLYTALWDNPVGGIVYAGNWAVGTSDNSNVIELRNNTVGIADQAFMGANHSAISSWGDSIRYIGAQAFIGANTLMLNTIPSTVIHIGNQAFFNTHFWLHPPVDASGFIRVGNWILGTRGNMPQRAYVPLGVVGIASGAFHDAFSTPSLPVGQRGQMVISDTVLYFGHRAFNPYDAHILIDIFVPFATAQEIPATWQRGWNTYRNVVSLVNGNALSPIL